jgi:hypothetical protein
MSSAALQLCTYPHGFLVWCIFDQQHRSGIHHCRNSLIAVRSTSFAPQVLLRPARLRHLTSSSYVIPYVIILPLLAKSDLYIQGRDEKLITIGNKPVLPRSLIPTSERQVSIPQASVRPVDSFDSISYRPRLVRGRLQSFIGTRSTDFQAHHDRFP